MNTITSIKTGKVYIYDWTKESRVAYAEYMNPETKYDRVYYQINVYSAQGNKINFGFVDDIDDYAGVIKAVRSVIEWDETDDNILESMHSRFD